MTFSPRQILTAQQMRDLEANKPHAGFDYLFASSTAEADPGNGFFRINNGLWGSATELYLSKTDRNGNFIGALLQVLFAPGCWVWLNAANDQSRWFAARIVTVADATTYWKLGVDNVFASAARANEAAVISFNGLGSLVVGYAATSTTSRATVNTGSVSVQTQAGLSYLPGARARLASRGTGEWMEGVVSSYSGTTLTVTMDKASGTGTHADWNISVAGEPGATGAPLNSPAFTGTPTAPTASAGTNTTQLATTAFVTAAISALVGASPSQLDTLNELAAALGNDANFASTITATLAAKLNASSYTAADVLSKLLTVDGAGSGLDADKWKGATFTVSTSAPSGGSDGDFWFEREA